MRQKPPSQAKWVVAFQGARDDYQAAIALAERGRLEVLVTDWYAALDRAWFRALMRMMPSRVRGLLGRRFRPQLPSRLVKPLHASAALYALQRRPSSFIDGAIGRVGGAIARRKGLGVLAYSYFAHTAFPAAGENVAKVIFQLHPHPDSLRTLFTEEMRLVPECRESLGSELEMVATNERLHALRSEPALADACLVASTYTKRTLVENGIAEDRIRIIPYGVDLERFAFSAGPSAASPFRVLFVGQMVQRKGLKYLLDAWKELNLPNSELVLAGRGRSDTQLLARYEGLYQLEMDVSDSRLRELYATSDLFCMPSLAEGFGLVYLEALASGTPVLGTHNGGAADIITDGRDGFVLAVRDVVALRERLAWCHAHRRELRAMRANARATAERYTWQRFRDEVVLALDDLFGAQPV